MLQAYIDGSGTGSDVLVLAGYVATAKSWALFSHEWNQLLRGSAAHAQLECFKMQKMRAPEHTDRCAGFYRVIEKHVAAALAVVMPVKELRTAVDEFIFPNHVDQRQSNKLKDPYYFAFKAVVDLLRADGTSLLGITEPVDLFFDEERQKAVVLNGWDSLKRNLTREDRKFMGNGPDFVDDKKVLPVQAADLWAYWVRRWFLDGMIVQGLTELPFPWEVNRKDLPVGAYVLTRQDFLNNFERIWPKDQAR